MACLLVTTGCGETAVESETATNGHSAMVELLEEVRDRTATDNPLLSDAKLRQAERALSELPRESPVTERFQLLWYVADNQARCGEFDKSISNFEEAIDLLPRVRNQLSPQQRDDFLITAARTYLRQGEVQNCVHCTTGESCILPLQGGGIHARRNGAAKSAEVLKRLLVDNPNHATAKWLLNVCEMALGNYPDGVPEQFRVAPEKFEAPSEFPRFRNVAAQAEVAPINLCGGTIVDDFDSDGLFDIVTSTYDPAGQIRFYHNLGNGRFAERTNNAGLQGILGGLNLIQADYDNDGDVDVLVLRGGWFGNAGHHPNSLLQNDGAGRFRDVTFECGLGDQHFPTQTAAWADYDNDGDLDLYVGNEFYPSQLFENDGQGHFVDVAAGAGVQNSDRFAKAVVWGDFDNDRLPDLYVSNLGQQNRLYHNNGDGTFTDVAAQSGVTHPIRSFPAWFWDYNNDGALDLFVSSYWSDVKYLAADYLDLPHEDEPDHLYQGDGRGGFAEVAAKRNLVSVSQPMGSNFGDLDNDGWLDMYLGTGTPDYEALMPNLMYRNHSGTRFEDVTIAGGFGHLQKGHGVAFADLDNDGDQDIYIQMGGAYPGDGFGNVLFENPGFDNRWIRIKLVGRDTNRCAIGARICVKLTENGQPRSIYKWVNSGGSFGANPLEQHIGLGSADTIDAIEVWWPTTGKAQVLEDIAIDQAIEITEGRSGYRSRNLKKLRFP